jgi:hypothetical protein
MTAAAASHRNTLVRATQSRKDGTVNVKCLVTETLLPIDDVNTLIELSPIILVILTIIGIISRPR